MMVSKLNSYSVCCVRVPVGGSPSSEGRRSLGGGAWIPASASHTDAFAYVLVPSNLGNMENLWLCPANSPSAVDGPVGTFYYVFMMFFHLAHILDAMDLILLSVVGRVCR